MYNHTSLFPGIVFICYNYVYIYYVGRTIIIVSMDWRNYSSVICVGATMYCAYIHIPSVFSHPYTALIKQDLMIIMCEFMVCV